MSEHLDLDALADVLAGQAEGPHLEGCDACRASLAELELALAQVTDLLHALPDPELPEGLAERLDAAVALERRTARAGAGATVTPLAARRGLRWMPVAGGIAAAAVLVTGGIVLTHGSGRSPKATTAAGAGTIARSSTGTAYARDGKALAAELPALLKGNAPANDSRAGMSSTAGVNPQSAPLSAPQPSAGVNKGAPVQDPLAALRGTTGLAACLSALTDPHDPGVPLALDYATFDGQPALVAVLPSAKSDKVDVFVVGAGCSAADANLLFFARLAKP